MLRDIGHLLIYSIKYSQHSFNDLYKVSFTASFPSSVKRSALRSTSASNLMHCRISAAAVVLKFECLSH
jgi:hypothetical protein